MVKWIEKARTYFLNNFGAPFILGFMALLLVCAGLLINGNSDLASQIADASYLLLVVGVVLQSGSYVLEQRKKCKK